MSTHPTPRRIARALLAAAITLGLSACSLPNKPVTQAATMMSKPFSNGEILQVMHTINNGEIKQSEVALQRSTNSKVKEAAQLMIRDHTASNQRIATIAQSTGIKLEESTLSKGLRVQTNEIAEDLSKLSGTKFDCTFLQKQAEQHALSVKTVRTQLLPAASNPQVKELLESEAPKLEKHLHAAHEGQSSQQCPRN